VPVRNTNAYQENLKAEKVEKIIPVIEMKTSKIELYALSDQVKSEDLERWDISFTKQGGLFPLSDLQSYLQEMKKQYPESDTILVIPDDDILYETIIQTMDLARNATQSQSQLFPNVVLSDKI
jgi:biopolymer transport protein ExbD